MTAIELLALLNEQGITLSVDGADLRISAPKGGLTPELRDELVRHKSELVSLLGTPAGGTDDASIQTFAGSLDQDALPLSFAQERLWFLDQLEPGSTQYNVPSAVRLHGAPDTAALTEALRLLTERHPALRCRYATRGRDPVAILQPASPPQIEAHDCRGKDDAAVQAQLTELTNRPFDLTAGPVFRADLLQTADNEYILLLVVHHIATDGASAGTIMGDWAAFYGELTGAGAAALPELPITYAEYAAWQRDHLDGPTLQQETDYWRAQLRGAPMQLDLPADKPRPENPERRGGWVTEVFPRELLEHLQGIARDHQSTLYMVLLAAFNLLLYRYSRQEDILVGTPVAGRSRTETEGLVGLFVNSVVIRSRFTEEQTFTELLAAVNSASLDALNHQDLPFEKLVEEFQPDRNAAVAPIFQVMFNLQNREHETVPFATIATSPVVVETGTAKFDLSVLMEDRSDGLAAWFEYSKDLYKADSIERMLGHYRRLLESIVADPGARLADLTLLEDTERDQLAAWNTTAVDYPEDATLVSLFEAQVAATPDAPAVTFGDETLSYAQLNARANKLANYLKQHGVMKESLVGVCMERSLDMVVALYGIIKAGAAYVPLDPDYPEQRLANMLEDAAISVILGQSHVSDRLPKSNASVVNTNIGWDAIQISYCDGGNPERIAAADNAAYVIFTSGSTGRPKGVLNEHRGIVNRLLWMQDEYHLDAGDRILQKTPYSFDVSVWEFFWPLLTGAELIVAEPGGHKDTSYLTNVIREHGITTMHFVPSMLRSFLEDPQAAECTSLLRVICSGEALPVDLQERFFATLDAGLHNLYGPTEAAIDVTYWPCARDNAGATVPIGRPVANTQIHIVDTAGNPCPASIAGELLIGGVQVARGYVNRKELTDERFIPDYLSGNDGARLYRTGDLARFRNDGVIEFLGRIDFQVKLRGFRIELGEIEAALQQCDGVTQAAVVLREDQPGDQRLAAYYVAGNDGVHAEALREQIAAELPDYMIPAAFVPLNELPLTASGKLDRNALPAPDWTTVAAADYAPPRNPEEDALCEIWADLLAVERVGIHDDFFLIGGHSLLATRVVARIRDTLRKDLALKTLFDHPTVAELCMAMQSADSVTGKPLTVREADARVPLSTSQQRLWILDQMDPGNCVYNIPWATRLRGTLNVAALQAAVDMLVARHAALRTAFVLDGNEPVQQISDTISVPLHTRDCAEDTLQTELTRLTQQSFALDTAPLVHMTLLRLADDDHVLHVSMHHIIGDAWSTDVFRRELSALYNAALEESDAALPELPVQFADYAIWQAERLRSDAVQESVSYWTDKLAGAPAVLSLPADRPRPAVQTYNGAWHELRIPRELTTALKQLANARDATLYMLLLTAFDVLLSRYSGQDDIVIGTPVAGRQHGALENLIGFFINTLALRTSIPDDASFGELLAQVKETALDAYAHQELPFEQLVEEIQPVRDTSYAPVFQVMFILQNAPDTTVAFSGLDTEPVLFGFGTAKLDLTLSMEEHNGELVAYFEYNTDLFDAETIAQLGGHFAGLLGRVAVQPDTQLSDIDLLSAPERTAIVENFNQTAADYPADQPLHELFMQQAANTPDAVAVECDGDSLTYAELDARSNTLAMQLGRLGAGPGIPVALCMQRSTELAVALLGILKSGSAYVPLDPDFPGDRLAYMLEDSAAPVLVTESGLASLADGFDIQTVCLDRQDAERSAAAPAVSADSSELAYVIYTSGSTGKPKGVAIEHRAAVNFLHSMIREPGIAAGDRWLAVTTLSFDISILEIFGPLLAGATVVLATRDTATDGFALGRALEQDDINIMQATPATWRMLLQTGWRGSNEDGRALKILCGGEALDLELAGELAACGGELWNMYGPTETTIWSTCERIPANADCVTVGRPIANTRCYVLDQQHNPVPAGVAGELFIGGDGVAREYLNRAELTAEKFTADPFVAGGRMYSTGDLARFRRDGRLEILGRADFQVKLRGFRIELGEIETAVAAINGIGQCVTMLREDNPGDQRLVAYFTADGAAPGHEELRTRLRERLPEYMVPAAFMELDSFPLTPNAKVDRQQLPAPEWQAMHEYVAPRTELEEQLAAIWCDVLGLEQVGVYDDFFALGGHSLLATRLISRILDDTGHELPFMTLFNRPTIDGLATELAGRKADTGSAIGKLPRDGKLPLSFAQQRLWFLDELSPGDPMYNIPWVMGLHGNPDRAALQTAIDGAVARHESLRTIFPNQDGEALQVILPELPVTLAEEDLRNLDEGGVQARLTELAQQRMSLANGPLTYVTLLRTGEDDYLLVLVIHHIIFDAWSHGILLNELAGRYNAALAGKATDLPALDIEFADYAGWQREWFESDDFTHQLNYWKNKLGDAPGTLELPTDKPRPPVQTSNGANISRMLSQDAHDGIKALCEREGVSLFMTLLAAFNILMARYSGQDDLLVGTPVSGRKRSELEKIVGFFLHTLVIRADLEGNPSFREFLARTKQTVLEAFAHQEMPFETLVEALDPERDTSRHPLFQVHFVLQHVDIDWEMFDGLTASPQEFEFGTAKFDIMFFVFDANDKLSVRLEYNTDLFEAATIERMIDHFETLLAGIITNPDECVGELPILPDDERDKLLVGWNDTGFDYPAGQTMHGKFESTASRQPDEIALWHDGTELSYRELNRRANKLAAELRNAGVGPEVLAAVCSERCPEMIIGMLAIQKAGGAYVPVDPDYPPQRVAHMLNDSEAPVLLTQSQLLERLPDHTARVICLDEFDWSTDGSHDENPDSGVGDDNLGYVIYTSGSTGLPKGVEIEHGNAVALIEWAGASFAPDEFAGVLASTSICFDLSVYEIFVPLGLGGRIVLVKDALALPELDRTANVTLINSVPSAMAELVRIKGVPNTVRTVNLAGEPLSTALVNSIYELGMVERVNDLYGPSEDTTYSTWTLRRANALPTIGRPIYNTQAYVLDPYGEPVPTGVPGELFLAGSGVTRGYRNRADLTADRYVVNPFDDANPRMYRTGDKVRYDNDGQLQFMGRLDHQGKLRGFRIELGEIETALASHPAVENTVVMAREDREGDKRLVAYIVASTEGLEGEELEQWEAEQVNQWQDLWQEAYNADSDTEDLALDFKGWNSSYTGEPIPHEEMLDWLRNTSDRILASNPQRVLEIGSGTGLIVGQVAPHVAQYTATDFSAASVSALQALKDSRAEYANLELRQCKADQIDEFATDSCDAVVLNSVAQYFPDVDYFRHFIAAAVGRVSDGGRIFLGDLRSAPLLEAYHTSVQLHQAEDELAVAELAELIRQRTEQEEELLIDPAFFVALQAELPAITGIRYQLKRSRFRNELARFRYDVTLEINGNGDVAVPEHLDWNDAGLSLQALRGRLCESGDLLVTAIPDARLHTEAFALAALAHPDDSTAAELRAAAAGQTDGIEAEDLYALADELGRDLQLTGTLPGQMTALFSSSGAPRFDGALLHAARTVPWRDYGNDPLQGRLQRSLVPVLKEKLAVAVPEYMMPSAFVIMDAFPLTPNGKINRKALPAPERKRSEQEVYVAPRTPVEEDLAGIWTQILGIKQIGVHDDFFALGGHSLLATQLISRIRDQLKTELPLLALFNHPTVAGLAEQITGDTASAATAAIAACDRSNTLPLSFAQQRLWFLDQLEGISSTYNVPLALRLEGRIDVGALQQSVNDLVARHESLRTTFADSNGRPAQVILESLEIPVDIVSLPDASEDDLQARLEQLVQTPFSLAQDALVRVHMLRSDDSHNILLLLMHHIVSDGWSLGILAREIAALYAGYCTDEPVALADLPIQYADYAVWQRGWLAGEELQRQLEYWDTQLDGAPALLQLPTDRPRQAVQTFNGAHINRTYSVELGERLRQLAGAEDCTLFMLLLAAYNVLLARYTGDDDMVVGTPIAGRTRSEIEGLIGFFVNTLALRIDLAEDPDFVTVLQRAKQTALAAYAHQELPFEKLVEELQPDRDTSHPPVFQTLFVLQENLSDDIAFHGTSVTPLDFELGSAKFDLSLFMVEFDDGLTASFEYNTDLFDAATIERMLTHLGTLLEAIADNPARAISELPLLDSAEHAAAVTRFLPPATELPQALVHELVERQAADHGATCALESGDTRLTYSELNARANRLARTLQETGAAPGTLVGILANRGIDQAVSVLATLKTGAAYVPIDPNYPADRIAYMLEDSHAPVVVTETALTGSLGGQRAQIVTLDDFDWSSGAADNLNVSGGDSVYAIYTSGSTGLPKGVELTHAGLNNLIQWQNSEPGLDSPARTLQFAALSFDVSFQELFTTWAQGGTVVLVDEDLRRDLNALARFIASAGIERVYLPFAALQPLAEAVAGADDEYIIRDVIVAGEQLQITPAVRAMFTRLGGARLHNQYGPSETHVVTAYTLPDNTDDWMALPPIGTPVANTGAYVLDSRMQPVPAGVPGELYLGGVQVARGYIHRAELTAERFVHDPFADADGDSRLTRMYRTGDRVRMLPDGNIEYLGRTDDQVKWRGFRIEPGEIETRLAEHISVSQAAVLLREDTPGDKRLVAYVVAEDDQPADTNELRDWVKAQLPDYMVPSAFMLLEHMPLTPSGKIARRNLPVPEYADVARSFVAPRTPVEETLAAIWTDILDNAGTGLRIGVHDDFFELGGHSLLATQLMARVRDVLNVELPLVALFNHPTIAEFATDVAAAGNEDALTPLAARDIAADDGRELPLSFAQQRLWFLDQLEPGNPVYNIPWAMRLTGQVNIDALQASVNDLVARHESLRTVFGSALGKAHQTVLPNVDIAVELTEAGTRDETEIEARLFELSRDAFELDKAPLMRMHLLRINDDDHVLLLVLHHIISDGWSIGVLYQELTTLYAGHCRGKPAQLPMLPVQYADYALWQQDWAESPAQQQQLDYWKTQLAGAPAILELPTDRPRGSTQTYNGAFVEKVLPAAIHDGLRQLSRQEGATLFMVCLAAFNVLLSRYSGQTDISVGTPIAGRRHSELDSLIGFFINTLVMRNDLSDEPSFAECINRIRETALAAFAHQELPFEKLVDELHPSRDMSHAPLFQTAFIMQNTPWDQSAELQNLRVEPIELDYGVAKFDLSLVMAERREGLLVHFEYNTDLFDAATIERMTGHFETLLLAVVSDASAPVSRLPLLTAGERQQILYDWNDTAAEYANDSCIHTLIETRAEEQPDAPAVLFRTDTLSFADLNARANRLAHYLIGKGAGPGTIIGISLERSPDLVTAILAIFKTGSAYVPLDPNYPNERLEWMLTDTAAPLLLTQSTLLDELPVHKAESICLDTQSDKFATQPDHNPETGATADDIAYVIYTSGSTGKPKGVMIRHQGVCNLADAQQRAFGLGPDDRMLQFASISFDASIFEIVMGLQVGAAMVLAPQDDLLPGEPLLEVLQRHAVTAVTLPPTALTQLPPAQLPDLHTITVAGEACPPELMQNWASNKRRFFNLYGPTESTVWASYTRCIPGERVTIGKPISNARLYVLDEHQQPVPVGVPGELCIGGAGLARGYLNRPELSAEKFLADPFRDEDDARIYRSGDLVRFLPDGNIEFLGRIDHQVKVRGFRIELGEIENALGEHPDVSETVVLARGAELASRQLVAYLVPRAGCELSLTDLRAHLQERLPEFMVPAAFVSLDEFPLTPNRKVDRDALPEPEEHRLTQESEYVAPRTAAEIALADIWQAVLNLDQVGINDNFFELGGDSILSIQIIARAAQAQLHLTPKQLFEYQTIAELAVAAASERKITAEQDLVTGPVALTPIQAWFTGRGPVDAHHFNQSQLLESPQDLDRNLLNQALNLVVEHHDALRLTVDTQASPWTQAQTDHGSCDLVRLVNLRALKREDQSRHTLALANALQAGFDLEQGPLIRALLFKRSPELPDQLLIAVHHMAVDWVSWNVLLQDLQTAYNALLADEAVQLPLKTSSFRAWSEKLAGWANSDELHTEIAHWTGQNWAGAGNITCDKDTDANDEASARDVTVWLSEDETRQLQQELPRAWRAQINDVLLTGVARAIGNWTGGDAVAINLEGHGREDLFDDIDLSRTIGWFTSLYPTLLPTTPDADMSVALANVKQHLRDIPNKGLGYGVLRYLASSSQTRAAMAEIPEPQIGFNYLGQLDQVAGTEGLLRPCFEPRGKEQSPRAERPHLLDVAMAVVDGRLQIAVIYSDNRHTQDTASHIANDIAGSLRRLIEDCAGSEAQVWTPADFPLAALTQSELTGVLNATGPVDDLCRVTPLQHGMLFHSLYSGDKDVYFARFSWRLSGALDAKHFASAWQQAIDRNTSLRTSFSFDGLQDPVQIVNRDVTAALQRLDWSGHSETEQASMLREFLEDDQNTRFDFGAAPLLRLMLIRLGPDDHRFIWSFHHAILDGWSVPLVLKEVFAIYDALCAGTEPALPEPAPFSNYLRWLDRQDGSGAEAFWRRTLQGFTAPTPLPAARVQQLSPGTEPEYAENLLQIDAETVTQLRDIAQQSRITLNTIVQGVWALLLSRYSGEDDVLFGATTSGRPAEMEGVAQMIGLFLNTLPARIRVDGETSLLAWLQEIQEQQLDVRQHEFASLVEVQGWSDVPRGTQMFGSMLAFENYPDMETMWTDTDSITIREVDGFDRTNFPLTLNVAAFDVMQVRMVYNTEMFAADAMERLAGHFRILIEGIVANPRAQVADLSLLSETERHHLLVELNDTQTEFPENVTLQTLFEEQVARTPDAEALVFQGESLSYREFNARANQLAHWLQAAGVQPNNLVGVHTERSFEMLIAIYGVLKAGGAYVPLDPEYPEQRLQHMLEDADVSIILTHSACADRLPESSARVFNLNTGATELESQPTDNPAPVAGPDELAYTIFTSGSTGRPKGVMNAHRGICNRMLWQSSLFGKDGSVRAMQKTPYSFDVSLWELFWPLQTGGTLVIARPGGHRDSRYLCELIQEQRIDMIHFVPSMLQVFLQDAAAADCPTLQHVLCSGEALPYDLTERFFAISDAELHNLYGPTEAAIEVAYWRCERDSEVPAVPIGYPTANTKLYIVEESGDPAPVGVAGELWIGGVQVARGYVNRPELTAERFIEDPFSDDPGARVYRTGDLVRYREDGAIEYLGRIDHQIKLRGFRIELGEIEAALDADATVAQSVVMVRERSAGNQQLVAYLIPVGDEPDTEALQRSLAKQLPDYMVPSIFVTLDEFPLLSNGKVDRKALPEPEWSSEREYVAPRNDTEASLAAIWQDILEVEQVGIHDDFFALGGHSLIAIRLASRILEQMQVDIPLDKLFEAPTVAALADSVNESRDSGAVNEQITPITRKKRRRRRRPNK